MNDPKSTYPSLKQAWMIFLIFLAASIGVGLVFNLVNSLIETDYSSFTGFLAYNLSMLFVIWFAWKNMKDRVSKVFHFNRISPVLYPILIVFTLSLAIALDPITSLIPMPEKVQELFKLFAKKDVWTFLMVAISGPVLEELLFRGIILDGFLKRYTPGKAIFWSAFLFGLFHLNPWQFIPGFIIGLLIGYIYFRTRSLTTAILIHMVNNTFSYLIMYFYGEDVYSFMDIFTEGRDYYIFLGGGIILFLTIAFILYKIINKNHHIWTSESTTNSS